MLEKLQYKTIPIKLTEEQFNQFFCPYLFFSKKGRPPKLLKYKYFSVSNRKLIFNRGMIPNIKENRRNRKSPKRGRKRIYSDDVYQERFRTIERAFAWEDKFKRLLLRFERISSHHFGLKIIAYTLINLRHFC